MLYLIWILHQTTTTNESVAAAKGCILFGFYIKPQPLENIAKQGAVVSYLDSTSNHNRPPSVSMRSPVVSYLDSTSNHNRCRGGLASQ